MFFTALVMGLAGSLHCLGMCSPLATAATMRKPFLVNRLVYNAGRIFTYGILGAMVSSFGALFRFSEFQNILTISLGALMIIFGLAGVNHIKVPLITPVLQRITIFVKKLFAGFLQRRTILSIASLGILNGLLPCGLTFLALTSCLVLPNPIDGFFFMLIFGAGTLPVMLGFTSIMQLLMNRFKLNFRKLTTAVLIAVGTLLVSRSLYVHHHVMSPSSDNITICR